MRPPRRTSGLVAVLLVSLAILFAATAALSGWYHRERVRRARAHISAGHAYTEANRPALAVEEYRAALLLERSDFEAERGLALTLLQLGQLPEAVAYLGDLLRREPTSGPLNLGMARAQLASGSGAEARRLYQRAIYGEWPDESSPGRITARFELAEYLLSQGAREETLAELLRLKGAVEASDAPLLRRLATLLLRADAANIAADVLVTAAAARPDDPEVLSALADAQSRAGRASDARGTLRRLLALEPERGDVRERLLLVDRVLTLDPTLPNLRITTRTRRARELLRTVVDDTALCAPIPGDAAALREEAESRLRRRLPPTPDAAEEDLARSVQLWVVAAGCRQTGQEGEAVSRVIERVQRTVEDAQR